MFRNTLKCFLSGEKQYLSLISNTLHYGEKRQGRNGITYSLIGQQMRFSLRNNVFPLLTTKKMAWKTCLHELLWFIRGETDNTILNKKNIHIWDANASRDFLKSRNLLYEKDGDLGPIYGHQWRHFNAPYIDCDTNYQGQGIDQLQNIMDGLKNDKYSRRLILSAWNPCQLNQMALPPCHILCQFSVNMSNELSCILYQRSGDLGLGIPFNIASYSFLLCLLAKHCDLKRGELIHFIGDAHIYEEHRPMLHKQLTCKIYKPPLLKINNTYDDIGDYTIKDISLQHYHHNPPIHMPMIA